MIMLICWKAGILLLWLCASAVTTGQKTQLHFSYITSMTGNFVSSGGIPVVDLALEQINNRTDILPNYTLNYTTILDSQVSKATCSVYLLQNYNCEYICSAMGQLH